MKNSTTEGNYFNKEKFYKLRQIAKTTAEAKKRLPNMTSEEAEQWAEKLAQQMSAYND